MKETEKSVVDRISDRLSVIQGLISDIEEDMLLLTEENEALKAKANRGQQLRKILLEMEDDG